jgi:hypothetical protein
VLELQELLLTGGSIEAVDHLAECVECRIRTARLARAAELPLPSQSSMSRILASDTRLNSALVATAASERDSATPSPGELWRIGEGDALLVWVRKVFDHSADVMPVVLDVDLADDQTLLLPADATMLGMELGLVTSVRGHVHADAFLSRVGHLGDLVARQVADMVAAAQEGRQPQGMPVGTPVHDPDDQRVEYQQTLADLLAGFGPGAWTARRAAVDEVVVAGEDLHALVANELVLRHRCTVHPSLPAVAFLPRGAMMQAVARVSFADTSIVVVVLPAWQSEAYHDLAAACRWIVRQEPGAAAVAVCSPEADRLTMILDVIGMREAYESPGGQLVPPHASREPMQVIDALAKYLDRHAPAWEDVDSAVKLTTTDLAAAARLSAHAAVEAIVTQGSRAHTPAKKEAWTSLAPATADAIATMLDRLVAGEPVSDALDRLLEGPQP